MRLRNDPKAKIFLLEHQHIYSDMIANKELIDFANLFDNPNPVYLEIGMGKGQFIIEQALRNPDIDFIGLELNEVICSKALKRYLSTNTTLHNLYFIRANAKDVNILFRKNSISKLFLNFSDPWPKKRHEKNRLTSPSFLLIYDQILNTDAEIEFKTDNESLYAYTLETLQNNPLIKINYYTNDLYAHLNDKENIDNIATEYEQKFAPLKNINKINLSLI